MWLTMRPAVSPIRLLHKTARSARTVCASRMVRHALSKITVGSLALLGLQNFATLAFGPSGLQIKERIETYSKSARFHHSVYHAARSALRMASPRPQDWLNRTLALFVVIDLPPDRIDDNDPPTPFTPEKYACATPDLFHLLDEISPPRPGERREDRAQIWEAVNEDAPGEPVATCQEFLVGRFSQVRMVVIRFHIRAPYPGVSTERCRNG